MANTWLPNSLSPLPLHPLTTDHHGRDYIPLKQQPNRWVGEEISMCMCVCVKRRGRTSERSGFSHISVIGITSVSQSPTIYVRRHVFLIPSFSLRIILYVKTRQTFEPLLPLPLTLTTAPFAARPNFSHVISDCQYMQYTITQTNAHAHTTHRHTHAYCIHEH